MEPWPPTSTFGTEDFTERFPAYPLQVRTTLYDTTETAPYLLDRQSAISREYEKVPIP